MCLTFREFNATDADYELLAEIESTIGDGPKTPEELRQRDQQWNPDLFSVREFILAGDQCIGADLQYRAEEEEDDTHSLFFTLLPAFRGCGLDEAILENLIDKARNRGVVKVWTNCRDYDAGRIQALERLGLNYFIGFVESKLDLERFDPGPFAPQIQRVEEQGITILSAEALSRDGVDWLRLQYDFMNLHLAERHPTDETPRPSYEAYREEKMNFEGWFPTGQYGAFDGKTCVGVTSVYIVDDVRKAADTELTYVSTSHRRKGIATALKVVSLRALKQAGIRVVTTNNEPHIPMLQLNYLLGFEKVNGIYCYWKQIEAKSIVPPHRAMSDASDRARSPVSHHSPDSLLLI